MRDYTHVLALLALGLLGDKDRAATTANGHQMSAHAVAGATGGSRSADMVAALANSELDLESFVASVSRSKTESKGKSNGDVEQEEDENQEPEEPDEDEQVEEDEDESDEDDDASSKTEESSKAGGSPPSVDQTKLIGRDKKGMFKNHKNFVRLRNKINEQESGHQKMFDSINEKLQDSEFIAQAIDIREEPAGAELVQQGVHQTVVQQAKEKTSASSAATAKAAAKTAKTSSQSEAGMSDADVACYTERYSDLGGMDPREHYLGKGRDQGRQANCAPELTDYSAQRYLDQHPDLQHTLGRHGRGARAAAKQHYIDHGLQEKRDASVPEWDEIWLCGTTSGSRDSSCKCKGTVYYGYEEAPDTRQSLDTFAKFRQWKTYTKVKRGDEWTNCNHLDFGLGSEPDYRKPKQCWCEPEPREVPSYCAEDGGQCLCNGLVYYMRRNEPGTTRRLGFFEAMEGYYTVNQANNTGSVKCSRENFEDIVPNPGEPNVCHCDEHHKQLTSDLEWFVKEYWRGRKAELEATEAKLRAEAQAQAARERAAEEAAREAARLKEEAAAKAAAQKKADEDKAAAKAKADADAKAAQAAAKKKAEDEAAAAAKRAEEAAKRKAEAEAAKAKAEAEAAAAAKEVDEAARKAAQEKAEHDRQEAAKAAIAAALAEQQARHDEQLARLKAKQEAERIEREQAAKVLQAQQNAEAAAAEEAERQAREDDEAAQKAALAQAKAAEADRVKAAMEKLMAEALERQRAAFDAKAKAEAEQRAKDEAERQAREAELLAQKQKEEAAAEAARRAAEEEERRRQEEADALAAKLKKEKEDEEKEKRRLEQEAYERAKKEQQAKDALIRAQKLEELAKTEDEVKAAQEAAANAQRELEDAEKSRQAALDAKNQLLDEIEAHEAQAKVAADAAKAAREAAALAKKNADRWKQVAEDAKKKAADDMARAEAAAKALAERLDKEKRENERKHAAALVAQAAAFKEAQEAQRVAHEAAEAARKRHEEKQIAEHKRQMAERRAHFERKFRNVWSTGPTGASFVQLTVDEAPKAEELVSDLFHHTLIADVEHFKQKVIRSYVQDGHESIWSDVTRLVMITSDDRVAELIEAVAAKNPNSRAYPAFDLVVTPLATGSKEYIEWVKLQTLKKDADSAFYHIAPDAAMHGLDNHIAAIKEVADVVPGATTHMQTEAEDQEVGDDEEEENGN